MPYQGKDIANIPIWTKGEKYEGGNTLLVLSLRDTFN